VISILTVAVESRLLKEGFRQAPRKQGWSLAGEIYRMPALDIQFNSRTAVAYLKGANCHSFCNFADNYNLGCVLKPNLNSVAFLYLLDGDAHDHCFSPWMPSEPDVTFSTRWASIDRNLSTEPPEAPRFVVQLHAPCNQWPSQAPQLPSRDKAENFSCSDHSAMSVQRDGSRAAE
jgi:hypothetical protein